MHSGLSRKPDRLGLCRKGNGVPLSNSSQSQYHDSAGPRGGAADEGVRSWSGTVVSKYPLAPAAAWLPLRFARVATMLQVLREWTKR